MDGDDKCGAHSFSNSGRNYAINGNLFAAHRGGGDITRVYLSYTTHGLNMSLKRAKLF